MGQPQMYTCLTYADAEAAIGFLTALGFQERLVVRDEERPDFVIHSEFVWRDTAGVMLSSRRADDPDGFATHTGVSVLNLVVEHDDLVDELVRTALHAGAHLVREPYNPDHGGRSGAVRDGEGNLWNVDSYQGAPAPR